LHFNYWKHLRLPYIASPVCTLLAIINTMLLTIQLVVLLAFLMNAVEASGDRRGSSSSRHPPASFSSQEQALFGNCNSEDCIFGSPSTDFGPFPKDVVEVKNKTKSVPETDKLAAGFGGPTAFVRKR
jgi:hypothetical protein